jgi:exosortase A
VKEAISAEQAYLVPEPGDGRLLADQPRTGIWLMALCLGCWVLSFRETFAATIHTWSTSKTYSHCFLIPPMFAYLVWIRRKQLFALRPTSTRWGVLCLGIFAVLWVLGYLGESKEIQQVALVAIFGAAVLAVVGLRVFKIIGFPLAFLFFMVPFGVALVPILQDYTAWFAFHALNLSHLPVVLENRTISLPSGNWTIAETCSGIRYLFASVVLGIFYASLVYRSWQRRITFVAASAIVPVFANALRAYGIVLVGYLSDNRMAVGVDHIVYGGVFFVVIQVALLVVGLRWRQEHLPEPPRTPQSAMDRSKFGIRIAIVLPVFSILICTPLLARYLWNRSAMNPAASALLVDVDPAWHRISFYDRSWDPPLHNPDRQSGQEYQSGEGRVHLYWALYSGQGQAQLAGSALGYGNPGFWTLASERLGHESLGGHVVPVEKRLLQAGLNKRYEWTLYWVAGQYAASAVRVKLLQARARLLGKDAAVIVVLLGSEDPANLPNTAESSLQRFLARASFSVPTS